MSGGPVLDADRVIALNSGLKDAEQHLNHIQSHYRLLASAWMLGAIGAAGFLLFPSEGQAARDPLLPGALCLSASFGTVVLWLIDRIYQRLIGAHFNEGLALEEAFRWLPQVRHLIRAQFQGTLARRVFVYYLAMATFLWVVGSVMVVLSQRSFPPAALAAAALLAAVYFTALELALRAESVALNLAGSPIAAAQSHGERVASFREASRPDNVP